MISSVSSQAGIVASRRKKLDQTGFNSYRSVIVESDDPYPFVLSPPSTYGSFTARHIYRYDKGSNTFDFLGTQKAQSLKRIKTWVNQIIVDGFTDGNINGTYTRALPYENFYKVGNSNYYINNANFVYSEMANFWENENQIGFVAVDLTTPSNSYIYVLDTITYPYDNTPPTINILFDDIWIDNTSLNNINNNRLYDNTNPDLNRIQLVPNVNLDPRDIFIEKNLPNNQIVFIDVRWVSFRDGRRNNFDGWWENEVGGLWMNYNKGNVYRAGIIIKDNIIDDMTFYTDLVNNVKMYKGHILGI